MALNLVSMYMLPFSQQDDYSLWEHTPVGGEQDGAIDVADVEHYLGLYSYMGGPSSPNKKSD